MASPYSGAGTIRESLLAGFSNKFAEVVNSDQLPWRKQIAMARHSINLTRNPRAIVGKSFPAHRLLEPYSGLLLLGCRPPDIYPLAAFGDNRHELTPPIRRLRPSAERGQKALAVPQTRNSRRAYLLFPLVAHHRHVHLETERSLAAWSIWGSIHAFLPALVESANVRTSGIRAPQAGFGHSTVLAQSQAMTVASPPPSSFVTAHLRIEMADALESPVAHPLSVIADILCKSTCPCHIPFPLILSLGIGSQAAGRQTSAGSRSKPS